MVSDTLDAKVLLPASVQVALEATSALVKLRKYAPAPVSVPALAWEAKSSVLSPLPPPSTVPWISRLPGWSCNRLSPAPNEIAVPPAPMMVPLSITIWLAAPA